MKQVCVYAASSKEVENKYLEEAKTLAIILVKHNIKVLYGGGEIGLMGALADEMLRLRGDIKGVIPQFMVDRGWSNTRVEQIVTEDIHKRKALFLKDSSLAIALPGGIGTLEELLEAITWHQLGLFNNPVVIINSYGFYDNLIAMLETCKEQKFMRDDQELYIVVNNASEIESLL